MKFRPDQGGLPAAWFAGAFTSLFFLPKKTHTTRHPSPVCRSPVTGRLPQMRATGFLDPWLNPEFDPDSDSDPGNGSCTYHGTVSFTPQP